MLKQTKFIIGLTFLAQSFTFLIVFFVLYAKKKSLAGTFLALSAAGGVTGGILVYKQLRKQLEKEKVFDAMNHLCDLSEYDEYEEPTVIPVDDTVDENEFK